jgi:hypothetical protein
MMEGPCADSEEKREPAGDIDTVVVDGLKVLDPKRPIREADILAAVSHCSVPAETCESNVRFGINSLVTSAVGRTGDLGSSKNLDFQAPWHHFQLVRLFG